MTYQFLPDSFDDPAARQFIEAVADGDTRTVLRLLQRDQALVNIAGHDGETALLVATERRNLKMVSTLLKAGAHPDGAPDRAPLTIAVGFPDLSIAKILISGGADPNGKMSSQPALYRLALIGSADGVALLLSAGARVDEPDDFDTPPSFAAAGAENWRIVRMLLDHGASLSKANKGGFTIGIYAHRSRMNKASPDGAACQEILARWRDAGLPWPPPHPIDVRAWVGRGDWPPRGEGRQE